MRKLLFRYPNVSYRQSEGEYRMVESIKNQIQKLFLSALIFHLERPVSLKSDPILKNKSMMNNRKGFVFVKQFDIRLPGIKINLHHKYWLFTLPLNISSFISINDDSWVNLDRYIFSIKRPLFPVIIKDLVSLMLPALRNQVSSNGYVRWSHMPLLKGIILLKALKYLNRHFHLPNSHS